MSPLLKLPVVGHRMSSLPVVQYCGPAGALSQISAGRAAAQSTAFHAICAKAPNANELAVLLSDDEYQEMQSWKKPADVRLGDPLDPNAIELRYADAMKEFAVALNANAEYVDPSSPDAVTIGHPDMAWIVQTPAMKIAYVGDIKRNEFTAVAGVDSLQLHAYGLAVASKYECDAYAVGLWAAIQGQWQWSELIDMWSAAEIAQKVIGAAMNRSTEYSMGPHCRDCYGRLHCPAYLLPPELASTKLAPIAHGGTGLTQETAAEILLLAQRAEDTLGAVKKQLKAFAARNRGIRDPKTGKVWKAVVCQGKESVSVGDVRDVFGPDAEKVISKGKPYERYGWQNQ